MPDEELIIRPLTPDDAERFLRLCQRIDAESGLMAMGPGERDWTVEHQRTLIVDFLEKPNAIALVAEIDGELVGFARAFGSDVARDAHVLTFRGIGVLAAYGRHRIGSRFVTAIEEHGRARGMYRVEGNTTVINARSRGLFRRHGFLEEGIKRAAVRIEDRFIDAVYFSKLLA